MVSIDNNMYINIITVLILHRQCAWYKHVKVHQDHLCEGKSSASNHVNINHTNYFLLNFKDEKVTFVDAFTSSNC